MRLVQVISDYIRASVLSFRGDIIVRGIAEPLRLPAGDAGTYLMGQGIGVIPAYITPPVVPATKAWLSANQSLPTATWAKVQLDTTLYDTTSDFDAVNHRWVCSETGMYHAVGSLAMQNIGDGASMRMQLKLNGVDVISFIQLVPGGIGAPTAVGSVVFEAAATNFVEMTAYHTTGANRNIWGLDDSRTFLIIYRVF